MFKPKFTITPEINNIIAEIEQHKVLADQAAILPELAMELRFRATVESVHSSTSIEGNPLNEQQVVSILHGQTITASNYAITEILNYKRALDWLSQGQRTIELSPDHIKQIHQLLMSNLLPKSKIGCWRKGPIFIVDEINNKEIVQYEGPIAADLPKLISSFVNWVAIQQQKQYYHPVLLAGLIHYIFVSIHPFSDGNGRATRLLTYHYLKSNNYDLRQSLSLDAYYLQNRQEYYSCLSRGKNFEDRMEADITIFIDFFTKGFLQSVKNVSKHIQAGRVLESGGQPLRLNHDELQLLDYIYKFGTINISEAVSVISAPKRTTQRRLLGLVKNNILEIEGIGPATRYRLISKNK